MQGFDLNTTVSAEEREDEGTIVPVRDVSGNELSYDDNGTQRPTVIRIAGTYSKRHRDEIAVQRNRMMKRGSRGKLSGDDVFQQTLELIAACILSWEGIFVDGVPYILTKANAIALLKKAPWIREDLEVAMGDHERFFATPSTN